MRLLRFFLLFLILPASAADRVSVSLTFTNATADGDTFVLNGVTRTWKTTVTSPSIQISNNASYLSSKTNFYNQVALNPFSSATMLNAGASNVTLVGASGVSMLATVSGTWGFVTYSTQTVATLTAVRVPVSGEPTAAVRTNIGSGLVAAIEDYSTNSLNQNSTAASELVGLTNAQTITGAKYFSGPTTVSNVAGNLSVGWVVSTNINGTVGTLAGGYHSSPRFSSPLITNATFYGSSYYIGNADFWSPIGFNGYASTITAASENFTLQPETGTPVVIGSDGSTFNGIFAYDGIYTNYLSTKTLNATNVTFRGPVVHANTNVFPSGSDISFGRYALSTLANGANSIAVGTNVFIQVSGPSGAFTINGIDGQPNRDGKLLIVLNYTGQNMTIAHDSGTEPTAANRIYTMTGADVSTTANGSAILIYSASASRWVCINLEQ